MDTLMKILIVDDEIVFLKSLKMSLPTQGYDVVTASNGLDALSLLNGTSHEIDLILTDYAMPGLNGIDLIKKVRRKYPKVPAILMTAYGQKKIIITAMHNHFDGYIEKPFVSEKLVEEIEIVWHESKKKKHTLGNIEAINYHIHQINNPLTVIMSSLDLANRSVNNVSDIKPFLKNIQDACRQINSINKKLLAQAKIANDQKELTNIRKLLTTCLSFMHTLFISESIQLEQDIEAADIAIKADGFGLEQAFHNLILNAVEAMENSPNKKIWVTAERQSNELLTLKFRDSGCGIAEHMMDHLFKHYHTSKEKGTGLGLSLVKSVVEDHGGRISALSLPEGGSVFTLSIPCGHNQG